MTPNDVNDFFRTIESTHGQITATTTHVVPVVAVVTGTPDYIWYPDIV